MTTPVTYMAHTTRPTHPGGGEHVEKMDQFFTQWAALSAPVSLAQRLQGFFKDFRLLQPTLSILKPEPVIDWTTHLADLGAFFQALPPALQLEAEKRRLGSAINIWQASHLGQDEVRNCRVLAWLLDHHGSHGQGSDILAAMLDQIKPVAKQFPTSVSARDRYWTRLESCPMGDKESRVDIEINGAEFLLFIEVKIGAQETSDQLDRYLNIIQDKAERRKFGVIYLTKLGQLPPRFKDKTDMPICPASWTDVISVIQMQISKLPDCFSRVVLGQYIQHLRSFR
jgi:hypothetical protein